MLALHAFTTLLAAAFSMGVQASPLSRRDVIAPKITSPDANTVWTVGSVVTVTWDTSNFPPDSQITNPIGKVILGFDENDSLNLDFNNPLAQDFKLRDGSVQLTVPDVPPRDDYLIVLFGDSGNTSPTFVITRIASGSSSSASRSVSSSTRISTPIPITGTTVTGGTLTDTRTQSLPTISDFSSAPSFDCYIACIDDRPAYPISSPVSSSESSSTTSATADAANATSAAWSVHRSALSVKTLSLCMASMVVYIML
ncbi:hypothetical protein NLJ89_g5356 [Agrocybe chaxingu]|uniref:Yeast cell wall synthesis Kre9/Knh1-like N-terminal domain-containing protein n=1 Tax=Agrocybe chaxingu TaxID=84603 RepID=A0A9W8K1E0_9AGAR|nr:hypothetical protein NLJ89_g5356 [Agrocybe chaxingu]